MPYYILVDPQIEYGARNWLLTAKCATKHVMWRGRRNSSHRVVLSIFYLNVQDQRGFCRRRRERESHWERSVCGVILIYWHLKLFPKRNKESCSESDIITNVITHRCRSLKWLHKSPRFSNNLIGVCSSRNMRIVSQIVHWWIARMIIETVLFSLRLL